MNKRHYFIADQMAELLKQFRSGVLRLDQLTELSLPLQIEGINIVESWMDQLENVIAQRDIKQYRLEQMEEFICLNDLSDEYNEFAKKSFKRLLN